MLNTVAGLSLGLTLVVIAATVLAVLVSGGTAAQAVAWAAALALATRVLPILATFPIAYWPRRPEPAPRSAPGVMMVVARETWATVKLFFFYHPFEKLIARHEPDRVATGDTPVVLVHGFFSNAGFWEPMKRKLRGAGNSNLFSVNLEPPFRGIDEYAEQLRACIEVACERCASDQVVVVAHSMGGLVARACARRAPERIRHVVCLGTPHHGTVLASLVPWENTRQMRIGSDWLEHLNAGPGVPLTSIYSTHDNIIVPQSSAMLEGGENVRVGRVGHLDMAFSHELNEALVRVLRTIQPCPST